MLSALSFAALADTSEISVDLTLDHIDYVLGERVRAVIEVKNVSPDSLSVGFPDSRDYLFVEVYKSGDMEQLEKISKGPFVSRFRLNPNEAQKLEVYLGDHYGLGQMRRFLARPVLVHRGIRYEGAYRAFDMVPGMKMTSALQMFSNVQDLGREFTLLHWTRNGTEHIFLSARDTGASDKKWETRDLGAMMKITKPVISIMPGGKVLVLHRFGPESFIRSEFWSMSNALEFSRREVVRDPETAGQSRVKELYEEAGGVKPVDRPWWKFW